MRMNESRVLLQLPQLRKGLIAEAAFMRPDVEMNSSDVSAVRVTIVEGFWALFAVNRPASFGVDVWRHVETCVEQRKLWDCVKMSTLRGLHSRTASPTATTA